MHTIDYFDYFLKPDITFESTGPWHEAKHGYEFELFAFAIDNHEGYAVVSNADEGRLADMADIIADEFDAVLEGWLVLLSLQKQLGKSILAHPTEADIEKITYYDRYTPVWILKIRLNATSRLLCATAIS